MVDTPPSSLGDKSDLLKARKYYFSSNLSLSYASDEPLWIKRGAGQYLYDDQDQQYLDCVNNVAHIGHSHPAITQAAAAQLSCLNTNTRYLQVPLLEYARELTSTLPDPLQVCFFVCSGSEANDLALRLAREYTQEQDVMVLDVAYHGHLSSMIDISPYKYNGKGGAHEPKEHVHPIDAPDTFRGKYRSQDCAGKQYAEQVKDTLKELERQNKGIAAFYAESVMGCAGQIVLPDGYLTQCYEYIREKGGLCIADEVQVGFGRIGTHFWGFQSQNVVPDIVTMGKPIGNGYPMAAVVTTREIADRFANGMEYFNTFGGSTTACAVGLCVLRVLREEQLQQNAHRVGTYLKAKLQALMREKSSPSVVIGDVRGLGLFLGIELIKDVETLAPAAAEAQALLCHMKRKGVLVSTDGPYHNVIKIKPPLCFTQRDADHLVKTLQDSLLLLTSS